MTTEKLQEEKVNEKTVVGETLTETIGVIQDILSVMREVPGRLHYQKSRQAEMEMMIQDYNHLVELNELPYHQFAKAAYKHQENLRKRREYKDNVEYLTMLNDLQSSASFKTFFDKLSQTVGELRKMDRVLDTRDYTQKSPGFKAEFAAALEEAGGNENE